MRRRVGTDVQPSCNVFVGSDTLGFARDSTAPAGESCGWLRSVRGGRNRVSPGTYLTYPRGTLAPRILVAVVLALSALLLKGPVYAQETPPSEPDEAGQETSSSETDEAGEETSSSEIHDSEEAASETETPSSETGTSDEVAPEDAGADNRAGAGDDAEENQASGDGEADDESNVDRAEEDEREPLEWPEEWTAFDTGHYFITGGAIVSLLIATALGPREEERDAGGVLFDEDVRTALRAPTEESRRIARDFSDVLLTVTTSWPFIADAVFSAAFYHQSPNLGLNMALINFETLMVIAALQAVTNVTVSRERPYGRTCGPELSEDTRMCDAARRFESFFSGHTSQAFGGAALTCMHHMNIPLYGGGPVEAIPCITGFAMATATGMLRVVGDQHYLTDVIVGAAIGTSVGFLVPWIFHYNGTPATPLGEEQATAEPSHFQVMVLPTSTGIEAVGTF